MGRCVWRDGDSRVFRGFVYGIAGAVKKKLFEMEWMEEIFLMEVVGTMLDVDGDED